MTLATGATLAVVKELTEGDTARLVFLETTGETETNAEVFIVWVWVGCNWMTGCWERN